MEDHDRLAPQGFGHDRLGSLLGPDVSCLLVGADGTVTKATLPAAIAHALWAIPDLCGVEIMALTIQHGHWIDDWGQSV